MLRDRCIDSLLKVLKIVWKEVCQIGVLRVVPTLLDGVQLRGIRWQGLEREPIGMVFLEIRRRRTVRAQTIPDDDHVSTIVAMQEMKQPDQLIRVDVLRRQMEIER